MLSPLAFSCLLSLLLLGPFPPPHPTYPLCPLPPPPTPLLPPLLLCPFPLSSCPPASGLNDLDVEGEWLVQRQVLWKVPPELLEQRKPASDVRSKKEAWSLLPEDEESKGEVREAGRGEGGACPVLRGRQRGGRGLPCLERQAEGREGLTVS